MRGQALVVLMAVGLLGGASSCKSSPKEPSLEAAPRSVRVGRAEVSILVPKESERSDIENGATFTAPADISIQLELLADVMTADGKVSLLSGTVESAGKKVVVPRERVEGRSVWVTLHDEGRTRLFAATFQPSGTQDGDGIDDMVYCRASIQRPEPVEPFAARLAILEKICDSVKLVH